MLILDSHCDTPSQLNRLRNPGIDNIRGHVDFPKLRRGKVDVSFFAAYIPGNMPQKEALVYADKLITLTENAVQSNRGYARMAYSVPQVIDNKAEGLISIMLGLENASPIGTSLDLVQHFYDRGVRYITLCHSRNNDVCDSCTHLPLDAQWGGLSPFGKELVKEMNRLGILIDVSHISDESFYDVLACSKAPVVATHSCCRALSNHPRNMTDEMIRDLAAQGGVIQINFYPVFLDATWGEREDVAQLMDAYDSAEERFIADPSNPNFIAQLDLAYQALLQLDRPSYKKVVDHIDHAVQIAGIDHVGIGSDFDGICVPPEGLEDVSSIGIIFDEMRLRGYSEEDISKIAGQNFLRALESAKIA